MPNREKTARLRRMTATEGGSGTCLGAVKAVF